MIERDKNNNGMYEVRNLKVFDLFLNTHSFEVSDKFIVSTSIMNLSIAILQDAVIIKL